jgi:hypothetical protein
VPDEKDPKPLRLRRAVEPLRLDTPARPAAPAPEPRWTGAALRRAREGRGLTVHQLAERTKVTRHHIENVEADRWERLPPPVYLRGVLLALAKELRLDGQRVSRSYLDAMREGAPER